MQIIKDSRGQYVTDEMVQYLRITRIRRNTLQNLQRANKIETAVLEKCYAIGLGAGLPAGREEIGGESWMEQELMVLIYMLAHGKIILDEVCGTTSRSRTRKVTMVENHEHGGFRNLNPQEGIVPRKHVTNGSFDSNGADNEKRSGDFGRG